MAKAKTPKAKKTARRIARKKKVTPMSEPKVAAEATSTENVAEHTLAPGKQWEGTATEFILQYPESVKPKTIVEEAAKVGLTITASYASNVRSVAKKNGELSASGGRGSNAKPKGGTTASAREDDETTFMRLLNRLGEARAAKLLALYRAARSGK